MKSLIFDAGPIISLAMNNLLWILKPLKGLFNGEFHITSAVHKELVDVPLETKKFKFEAIQVEKLIEEGILEVVDNKLDNDYINKESLHLLDTANQIFKAYDNYIKIVHLAEMSVIAASIGLNSNYIVIDEKTTRFLIESPSTIARILRKTLHTPLSINENNLNKFKNETSSIKVIRSIELVSIAYEHGILDTYITNIPDARKKLLESVLWGVKLNGCAVSEDEIRQIMRFEER